MLPGPSHRGIHGKSRELYLQGPHRRQIVEHAESLREKAMRCTSHREQEAIRLLDEAAERAQSALEALLKVRIPSPKRRFRVPGVVDKPRAMPAGMFVLSRDFAFPH